MLSRDVGHVRPHSEANVAAQEATQRFMENVMVVDASVKRGSLLVKAMVAACAHEAK